MIRTIATVIALSFALSVPTMTFADAGGVPNDNAANGQANKASNCGENIAKQNANGQTGANTGSANDSKQANTAVTNCDGFWN